MAIETHEELPGEETLHRRRMERRRASHYLDLWERHVTVSALHGRYLQAPAPASDSAWAPEREQDWGPDPEPDI